MLLLLETMVNQFIICVMHVNYGAHKIQDFKRFKANH